MLRLENVNVPSWELCILSLCGASSDQCNLGCQRHRGQGGFLMEN